MVTQEISAFPIANPSSSLYEGYGLSRRELFAALAMQGYCAAPDTAGWSHVQVAKAAVKMADALIIELNEKKEAQK